MKNNVKQLLAITLLPMALFACQEDSPERKACLEALENSQMKKGAHIPALEDLIGKSSDGITSVDGFESFRALAPNSMMTMDYREDRVNLHLDCDNIIVATTAG